MSKNCLNCKHYRNLIIPGVKKDVHVCLGNPLAVEIDPDDVNHLFVTDHGYIWDLSNDELDFGCCDDYERMDDQEVATTEQLKNNQGKSTCFKCGTATKKVPGMLANSFFDVCPNCKI